MDLALKIKDDILHYIHRQRLDISKTVIFLEYSNIDDVYASIGNLLMGNVVSKLDPINTTSKDIIYKELSSKNKDSIINYYVSLLKNKETLVIVNNTYIDNAFKFQISIYSMDEEIPKEIRKYFDQTQYKDYKIEFEKTISPDNKKKDKETKEIKKKEKMHFISELLIKDQVDYLKLYQLLAIESNNLDILGKYTGSENIDISTDNKMYLFSNNITSELLKLNQSNLPKTPIITQDKRIVILGNYDDLDYIPSMIIFDTNDRVLKYTILGDQEDIKPIAIAIKTILSEYPSSLDNRFKHLHGKK